MRAYIVFMTSGEFLSFHIYASQKNSCPCVERKRQVVQKKRLFSVWIHLYAYIWFIPFSPYSIYRPFWPNISGIMYVRLRACPRLRLYLIYREIMIKQERDCSSLQGFVYILNHLGSFWFWNFSLGSITWKIIEISENRNLSKAFRSFKWPNERWLVCT